MTFHPTNLIDAAAHTSHDGDTIRQKGRGNRRDETTASDWAAMNGQGIETPANKIATAQATLELAIRLNGEVQAGRITTEIFKRGVTVVTGSEGLSLPPLSDGTDQDLNNGIYNITLIAISASALTLDETLDEVFGKVKGDLGAC